MRLFPLRVPYVRAGNSCASFTRRPVHGRRAPPAAAGREDPYGVARAELDGALVGQPLGPGLVSAGQEPVLARRPGLAPGQPPRAAYAAFGYERQGAVLQHLELA